MVSRGAKKFGQYLKDMGWTHEQAAKELGVARSYVTMLVRGQRNPSRRVSLAIATRTRSWKHGSIDPRAWDLVAA